MMVILASGSQRRALAAAFGPQATPPMTTIRLVAFTVFLLIVLRAGGERRREAELYHLYATHWQLLVQD
jgi:hypothetical protein